jgi:2-methylcitrate dehydratase PrpD
MWPLAALLVDGEIGPDQILEHRFEDPQIRSLVDRIELIYDPEIDALYKAGREEDVLMHSRVEIICTDGRVLDSGLVERGAHSVEWPAETLESKFRWLVGHRYDSDLVERLTSTVRSFEDVPDVRGFTALVS